MSAADDDEGELPPKETPLRNRPGGELGARVGFFDSSPRLPSAAEGVAAEEEGEVSGREEEEKAAAAAAADGDDGDDNIEPESETRPAAALAPRFMPAVPGVRADVAARGDADDRCAADVRGADAPGEDGCTAPCAAAAGPSPRLPPRGDVAARSDAESIAAATRVIGRRGSASASETAPVGV